MPVAAALVGTVAAAGIGAVASSSAAKKAANASQYAADQSTELQREALQTAQQNTATSRAAGDLATNALAARTGLIPSGSTVTPGNIYTAAGSVSTNAAPTAGNIYTSGVPYSSAPAASGSPTSAADWDAYIAAHPDLKASITGENANQWAGGTEQEKAADQYRRYGKDAGWELPTQASATTAPQTAPSGPPQVQTAANDVQLSAATNIPTYTRAPAAQAPAAYTPTNYTAPTYTRPDYAPQLDVSYDSYLKSGDAKAADFDIAKQGGQVQASLAAQGLLNSGAALKRLQEVGQDNKVKYYDRFRDYTTGQYNTDRGRFDTNYNFDTNLTAQNALAYAQMGQQDKQFGAGLNRSDYQYDQNRTDNIFNLDRAYGTDLALNNRGYETGRYDTQTGNLFQLAGLGQGASNTYTGAAQTGANAQSQNLFSNAANQGNAALAGAANINNLIGSGLSAAAYYYGNRTPAATTTAATTTPNIYAIGGGY